MNKIGVWTIGADPEVFLTHKSTGAFASAIGLIGGTKDYPRPMRLSGFYAQEDNVLAEFNIPPVKTRQAFVSAIHDGLTQVGEMIPPGYELTVAASAVFTMDELMNAGPSAFQFGCSPDFNAWRNGKINPSPNPLEIPELRSAGGHVLVGYENPSRNTNIRIIKFLDKHLGVPSVILDRDTERRKLYGKAGAFRHKPFGVEYRTLSSFWIGNDVLCGWVWDGVSCAVEEINDQKDIAPGVGREIEEIINTGNVDMALAFCAKHSIALPL
jgi:hypothetical protein